MAERWFSDPTGAVSVTWSEIPQQPAPDLTPPAAPSYMDMSPAYREQIEAPTGAVPWLQFVLVSLPSGGEIDITSYIAEGGIPAYDCGFDVSEMNNFEPKVRTWKLTVRQSGTDGLDAANELQALLLGQYGAVDRAWVRVYRRFWGVEERLLYGNWRVNSLLIGPVTDLALVEPTVVLAERQMRADGIWAPGTDDWVALISVSRQTGDPLTWEDFSIEAFIVNPAHARIGTWTFTFTDDFICDVVGPGVTREDVDVSEDFYDNPGATSMENCQIGIGHLFWPNMNTGDVVTIKTTYSWVHCRDTYGYVNPVYGAYYLIKESGFPVDLIDASPAYPQWEPQPPPTGWRAAMHIPPIGLRMIDNWANLAIQYADRTRRWDWEYWNGARNIRTRPAITTSCQTHEALGALLSHVPAWVYMDERGWLSIFCLRIPSTGYDTGYVISALTGLMSAQTRALTKIRSLTGEYAIDFVGGGNEPRPVFWPPVESEYTWTVLLRGEKDQQIDAFIGWRAADSASAELSLEQRYAFYGPGLPILDAVFELHGECLGCGHTYQYLITETSAPTGSTALKTLTAMTKDPATCAVTCTFLDWGRLALRYLIFDKPGHAWDNEYIYAP